jgi:L-asparaginase
MTKIILSNVLGKVGMPDAVDALQGHLPALDVVEAGIGPVEADPAIPYVGLGGAPNMLGEVECDASIVDGSTHQIGIVAGLKGFVEALWVARQVMEKSLHIAIGGEGAALFAAEMGASPREMLTEKTRDEYRIWKQEHVPSNVNLVELTAPRNDIVSPSAFLCQKKDTVIYLVRDGEGNIAAGGSTSGWPYKYPGRYGDTPLPGAGVWADNEGGACGCTHTGEMTARTLTAKSVVDAMRRGTSVKAAVHDAVDELRRLKGGYQGQVVIHAISREGEPYVVTTHTEAGLIYWIWNSDSNQIESFEPVVDSL